MNTGNISAAQIEELEKFFNNNSIPKVIRLHDGAIIYNDAPEFIRSNLALLKTNQLKELTATVRLGDLLILKKAIEEKGNE